MANASAAKSGLFKKAFAKAKGAVPSIKSNARKLGSNLAGEESGKAIRSGYAKYAEKRGNEIAKEVGDIAAFLGEESDAAVKAYMSRAGVPKNMEAAKAHATETAKKLNSYAETLSSVGSSGDLKSFSEGVSKLTDKDAALMGMYGVGGYFTGGSVKGNIARTAGVVGAYAGTSIAGRYISGGTIGHNADGERDIAGIPFL